MNYGDIKAAVIARSHRADLTSTVPEFVTLAEAEYNRRTNGVYNLTSGDDTAENWLSDNAPDVYIFGGLMQLATYTNDDAALQKYSALFERALEQAHWYEIRSSGVPSETLSVEIGVPGSYNIFTDSTQ